MADEKETKEGVNASSDVDGIYKAKYEELLGNSVPREEYDKIKGALEEEVNNRVENRQMYDEEPASDTDWETVAKENLDKIANNKCKTNLEFFEAFCDAREAVLETEHKDLFIQQNELITQYDTKRRENVSSVVEHIPTPEETERADRVYEGLRELIDESEGDPAKFNILYSKNVRKVKGL